MSETNTIYNISIALIGLGLALNLIGLLVTLRPQARRMETVVWNRSEEVVPEPVENIEAEFESFINSHPPMDYGAIYDVPIEHIRPGDMLKTMKMPAFVQSFKFREKAAGTANARA